MNADELLMCAEPNGGEENSRVDNRLMEKKERLYALAVSGKTKQYLGVEITWEQVQTMSPEDINKYYRRYESKLGSKMVQSLGHTLINLYSKAVSNVASIDSQQELKYDLEQDPVLTKGLESLGCDLYNRFGALLAPLIMGLITFNHINFENFNFWNTKNEQSGERSEPGERNEDKQHIEPPKE